MKKPRCRNPTCSLPGTSRPDALSATDSTEPRPENGVATDASGATRRSRRQKAPPITVSSTAERHSHTVVTLRVEGVSLSAIARMYGWPGTPCPLARARAAVCRLFNDGRMTGFVATELQADEIRAFTGGNTSRRGCLRRSRSGRSLDVDRRGRRSYRNTLALVRDVASRMRFTTFP